MVCGVRTRSERGVDGCEASRDEVSSRRGKSMKVGSQRMQVCNEGWGEAEGRDGERELEEEN